MSRRTTKSNTHLERKIEGHTYTMFTNIPLFPSYFEAKNSRALMLVRPALLQHRAALFGLNGSASHLPTAD
jgi:hypothetical protein